MVRSGDEPDHARSPQGLRLGVAVAGLLVSLGVGALFLRDRVVWGIALCAAGALASAVDGVLAVRRIRQGPHFQPGRDVPPYRPVLPERPARMPRPPVTERTRQRRYFALMGTCLGLLLVAWVAVRPFSTSWTVALTVVAMVIPPCATLVANSGWRQPGPDESPPGDPRDR